MMIRSNPMPSAIDWPRDEAAHSKLEWELWWVTAAVTAGDRELAAHLTLRHLSDGGVYTTATVKDLSSEIERSTQSYSEPGSSKPATDQLETITDTGGLAGNFESGYHAHGRVDEGNGFALDLTPTRPVVHNGGSGLFALGSMLTCQYSVAGLAVTGSVRLDGEELDVVGHAWYDRQWMHSGTVELDSGFTWFGLSLDNGDTISLWDTARSGEGNTWATVVRPDGTHIIAAADPVALQESDYFTTSTGRKIPRRWVLTLPTMETELHVSQQLVEDSPGYFFCTGALTVSGKHSGTAVTGQGFCDLVGWTS